MSIVVDYRRRYRFRRLEVCQPAEKVAHIRATHIVTAMMDRTDSIVQITPPHAVRNTVVTTLEKHAYEIVGKIQRRKIAFGAAARVTGCDGFKCPLVPRRVVVRLVRDCPRQSARVVNATGVPDS